MTRQPGGLSAAVRLARGDRRAERPAGRADRRRRPDRRRGPGGPRVRDPPRAAARGGARGRRAARRRAVRRAREGQAGRLAPALGRRRQSALAAHALPGPQARRRHAVLRRGALGVRLLPDAAPGAAHPRAADDEEPPQLRRVAVAARPLARRGGRGGRARRSSRRRRRRSCSSSTAACAACAPATAAAAGTARSCPNFEPGSDIVARVTVLCEGTQGHLTGAAIERFGLAGENPQVWALGVKEVWKVPRPLDRVIHTMGWPLRGERAATASSAARSSIRSATTWSRSGWSSGSTTATPSSRCTTCCRS